MLTKGQILDDRRYWRESFGGSNFRLIARKYNRVVLSIYQLVFRKNKDCARKENTQMLVIDKDDALKYAAIILRIKGKVTPKKFRQAGGKEIVFDGHRVFPGKKKK